MTPFLLPETLSLPPDLQSRLSALYNDGVLRDPAASIPEILLSEFALDVRARYGPIPIAHPIGKASGQLSLQKAQVQADADAGLAFVVLKTVIAEDPSGAASMEAWKIKEPRMLVERIAGRRAPREGWTVSWAGRGWEGSLQSYVEFMKEAVAIGAPRGMPVIPSCKFNLPSDEASTYMLGEYRHTLSLLNEYWREVLPEEPLVLEQDFSPTLAGTDMAGSKRLILKWLAETPAIIRQTLPTALLGVKMMNALFDDGFQIEMLETVCREGGAADFLVGFNRLFDPERMFGAKKGIAFGGPDLSDRNFWALERLITDRRIERALPISATGDIVSGRMMIEYALRGATSGQIHTFFQLPAESYSLKGVSRGRAALHELYFHPEHGLAAAMCHLRHGRLGHRDPMAFLDLPALGREMIEARRSQPQKSL